MFHVLGFFEKNRIYLSESLWKVAVSKVGIVGEDTPTMSA